MSKSAVNALLRSKSRVMPVYGEPTRDRFVARDGNDRRGHSSDQRRSESRDQSPAPKAVGKIIFQQVAHGRRKHVQVVTKRQSLAPTIYSCKWLPARNHGVIAAIKDEQGRVIFPDSRGPQPKNDGRNYSFQLVGPNAKGNVNFGYVLVGTPKVEISSSGKIICTNRRAPKISVSGKNIKPLPKERQGRVSDVFVRDDDFYFYSISLDDEALWTDHDPDCDGEYCECGAQPDDGDVENFFWQQVDEMERSLVNHPERRPGAHAADAVYEGTNDYGMPLQTDVWA